MGSGLYAVALRFRHRACLVESPCSRLIDDIKSRFAAFKQPSLPSNADRLFVSQDEQGVLARFDGRTVLLADPSRWPRIDDIIKLYLAYGHDDAHFVHSSCLSSAKGAWLFVGGSHSGKTTLSMGLADNSRRCTCDDLTPIDTTACRAYPFPTQPTLRPLIGDAILGGREDLPSRVGVDSEGWPIRAVVFVSPPDVGLESVDMTYGLDLWQSLVELVCGKALEVRPSEQRVLKTPTAATFEGEPQLSPCRPSVAVRLLLNHTYNPAPAHPLGFYMKRCANLVARVPCYILRPAKLDLTLTLIRRTLIEGTDTPNEERCT